VERQHGIVGNLPEQDWSLRVAWVSRRTADSAWELVHRHADGLVHAMTTGGWENSRAASDGVAADSPREECQFRGLPVGRGG
jgi:hypothetical protein